MLKLALSVSLVVVVVSCGAVSHPLPEPSGHLEPCPCVPAGAREMGDDHLCFLCLPDAGDVVVRAPGT